MRKSSRLRVLMFCLAMALLLNSENVRAQLAESPWPMFHGDAQHTGLSLYDTSHVDGTVKWSFETGGGIESSPSIGKDGTIYVGSHDGYLYAISKNGMENWKIKIGTPKEKVGYEGYTSILSSPAIGKDGTVYLASRDQYLYAISSQGEENWKFPINISFDSWASPVIGKDGTIYITSSTPKGGLFAINPDGTEKWHFSSSPDMFNSPAIGKDGTIYIGIPTGTKTNKLIAFNPDGTKKWETTTSLFLESTPAIADDGTIYIGSFTEGESGAGLYAISSNGKEKWHFTTQGKEVMSTPAIGQDGTVYFGSHDGNFYAIDPDGTEKWRFTTQGLVESSPAIGADGTIYFGVSAVAGNQPVFYALNPDGTEKWHNFTNLTSSVVSSPAIGEDGTVYVGSWDRNLYAFGGSPVDEDLEDGEGEEGIIPQPEGIPNGEGVTSPAEGNPVIYLVGAVAIMVVVGVVIALKKR